MVTEYSTEESLLQIAPIKAQQLLQKIKDDKWILERTTENGDQMFNQKSPNQIFMIVGTLNTHINEVVAELFDNAEQMPEWNCSVNTCEIFQKLNPVTDFVYQVARGGFGVHKRDFVTLRHFKEFEDGSRVLVIDSVNHPNYPVKENIIRGTHNISGWVLRPHLGNPNITEFHWVLDMELNFYSFFPKRLIEMELISASSTALKNLRTTLSCSLNKTTTVREPSANQMNSYNAKNNRLKIFSL